MNTSKDPENTSEWSKGKFDAALKLRNIWYNNFKHENLHIRGLLQDAWFPYLVQIQREYKHLKTGYELESNVFITDIPLPTNMKNNFKNHVLVQINFYWVPEITEDDLTLEVHDPDYEVIPVEFNKKQEKFVVKLMEKFSEEIGLKVNLIYE